ncbi:MAG: response regulator [Treponema sp.]|jgi:signal transduction histidine kinase/CheY-like chemotaxis protein/HPt (histidine-containing phosphotransfer) domain-containing protein|nr:response regulator [Treponema sp.]
MKTELLSRLFGDSPAAAVFSSRSGALLGANRRGEALFAPLPGEAQDGVPSDGCPLEQALFNSADYRRLVSGETGEAVFSLAVRDTNGPTRRFRVDAWAVDGPEELGPAEEEGETRFVLILRDETSERQEEMRLQEAMRKAEQAMEVKSQFLANMSHEIRTPIQTIIGMTELLQDTKLDREQSEYSRQVKFSADVLLSLINDILDYSKIEAGKMELEHIDFDLEQTIEQAVEMISLEAHKKGLEIALDIPPDTAIFIKGDPSKYRQIAINLVKNAVKFTKEGGITITAALTEWKGKEAVRVSVADTGIGVPEEIQDRLFTTFFQGDPSNTRQFGGTGLGLAISRNLVELMHGTIEMLPNKGGGSIFRFTIPIERSGVAAETGPAVPGQRDLRILVVDDRPESRRILVSCLQDIGYFDVDVAVSGGEALAAMRAAAARKRPFGLCFLDMIMPQMDGWRLAAEINGDEEISDARLILMVPHGLLGADAKMTLLKWFKAYINKPIKRKDLIRTMDEALTDAAEEPEAVEELEAVDEAEPAGPGPADGEKPLILVVEDHPVNQKLFALILAKLGYPVVLADDGLEALEKTAAYPVSFIFMDIQMPRMNGYEAAGQLRRQGFDKPIIAVTASAFSDERERCMNVGFDDILIKPFKRPDIEKILQARTPGKTLSAFTFSKIPFRLEAAVPAGETAPSEPVPPAPEAPARSGDQVFNRAEILETFMGNEEMIRSLLIRFIDRTREQIAADIPRNMEAGDWGEARRAAHTIKGSALTMAAGELGHTAARLEVAFKDVDKAEMDATLPLLGAAFTRFEAEAGRYLEDGEALPPTPPDGKPGPEKEA